MEYENITQLFQSNCDKMQRLLSECISGEIIVYVTAPYKTITFQFKQKGLVGNANVLMLFKNLQQHFRYNRKDIIVSVTYRTDVQCPDSELEDERVIILTFNSLCFNSFFTSNANGQKFFDEMIAVLKLFRGNSKDSKELGNPNLP